MLVEAFLKLHLPQAVRALIAGRLRENELRLALEERPRQTVFLIGQVGERQVSLHGERGRLIVHTEQGLLQELSLEQVGIDKKGEHEQQPTGSAHDDLVLEPPGALVREPADTAPPEAPDPAHPAAGDRGAGPVGGRDGGGAAAGADAGAGAPGLVAGPEEQDGDRRGAEVGGAAPVAVEPDGPVGDDGGPADPATPSAADGEGSAGADDDGEGPGERPARAAAAHPQAGAGSRGSESGDSAAAGAAQGAGELEGAAARPDRVPQGEAGPGGEKSGACRTVSAAGSEPCCGWSASAASCGGAWPGSWR
ncbi:MAG: hypothetical protein HY812_14495 [Planctomycetes bacterium]|nr:hypothetical protein [Planctomycetota bacterium]